MGVRISTAVHPEMQPCEGRNHAPLRQGANQLEAFSLANSTALLAEITHKVTTMLRPWQFDVCIIMNI